MSARDTIFAALITQLEAVTIANGYATTVVAPVQKNVAPQESRTIPDGQALVSLWDEGDGDVIQWAGGNDVLLETRYLIHCFIASTRQGLTPTALAGNWLGDMRKLAYTLNASPTSLISANTRSIEMMAIAGWNVTDQDALIVVPFKVLYWMDQVTP